MGREYTFMSMKINKVSMQIRSRKDSVPLFKNGVVNPQHIEYHADNIMKNSHFSFWNKLLFSFIDKVYPDMINHPKFSKHFVKITEKVLVNSNEFQHGIINTEI